MRWTGYARGPTVGLAERGADGLDILVNNAGIHSVSSIGQLTEEEFERLVAVNVSTPIFVAQRALPLLHVVGFLAGPRGRWVTGQTIDVSGGTYLGPLAAQ
ncbi:SDR family oxidoreductase [Streptomyces sp. NPDC054797]